MARRRRRRLPQEPVEVPVVDLAHDGRGVGRVDDKVTFVHGALPGEQVLARLIGRNRRFDDAIALSVESASSERVEPGCPWFGNCGGCALQHLDHPAQLAWKQQRLRENLRRIGSVEPETWAEPISGPPWHYRRRARLSARHVPGKGRVLVGFRELGGRYVADIENCRVLHPAFSDRLMSLSRLIGDLSIPHRIAQVECAAGDDSAAIVLRHLDPLTDQDLSTLVDWSRDTEIAVWLQPAGPGSVHRLFPEAHQLSYRLPDFDVELAFHPQQFIQINAEVNRQLTRRAIEWMAPVAGERILDLFCGLGNFSLPLARSGATVVGMELDEGLVRAAADNAATNGIESAEFIAADLAEPPEGSRWKGASFDGVLIDPPRTGAAEILSSAAATGASRIVYVSCDPATLARDAGELVHQHGFSLRRAGIADMFPHTAHVESIALFERDE